MISANGGGVDASTPSYDPSANGASAQLSAQQQAYGNFNSNMPYYQGLINSQAVGNAQNSYQGQAQSIDQNASSRGLLYSGLHDSAIQNAAANAAGQQASQEAQGTANLNNLNNQYLNQTIGNGLANYQGQVSSSIGGYQNNIASQAQTNQMIGSLLSGGGKIAGLAMSDKRAKKDIKDVPDRKLELVVEKLDPKEFEYKDQKHGEGKHYGIMAQDLEKSDIGKSMVKDTDEGKKVDLSKAVTALLALQNVMHKRLKNVEAK